MSMVLRRIVAAALVALAFAVSWQGSAAIRAQSALPPLYVANSTVPSGQEDQAYAGTLRAFGTNPLAYIWSVAPSSASVPPPGLTLAPSTGAITGTPEPSSAGSYVVTFQVTEGTLTAETTHLIRIFESSYVFHRQDVNKDGAINVTDVQVLVNHVLQVTLPVFGCTYGGNLDIVDVQGVVNCILTPSTCQPNGPPIAPSCPNY
jgi:hypothetical protein